MCVGANFLEYLCTIIALTCAYRLLAGAWTQCAGISYALLLLLQVLAGLSGALASEPAAINLLGWLAGGGARQQWGPRARARAQPQPQPEPQPGPAAGPIARRPARRARVCALDYRIGLLLARAQTNIQTHT